jgi:hypothetical protein
MHRKLFYWLTALVAFAIGIAFVIENRRDHAEALSPAASFVTGALSKSKIDFIPGNDIPAEEKFYCKDKEALKIWQILKKSDYINGQTNGVTETGDCHQYLQITHRLDLNDDGQAEIYVESGIRTGPVSFQIAWIYQKKGNTYKRILDNERDDNFKVLKTKTNGFHDLHFVSRRDIGSVYISDYKYENGTYNSVRCRVGFYDGGILNKQLFDCDDEKGMNEFVAKNR